MTAAVEDVAWESISEGGVEFSSNLFDRIILGKEVDLFEGVTDAMFSGLIMSAGVYKAPNLFKSVVNMVQGPDTNQKLSDNYTKIKEAEAILANNVKMSKTNQAALQNKINKLVQDSSNEINKTLNRFGTMPIETVRELSAIELEQFKVRKQLEGFESDPNMSEDAKKELVRTSRAELQELGNKKQKILEPIIKADAEAATAEQVELNIRKIEAEVETIKKFAGEGKVNVFETASEFTEATGIEGDVDAFIDPETNEIFINKEWAAKVGAVTAGSHELLHKILKSTFTADSAAAMKLVEDFKGILSSKELNIVQKRIDENYADASDVVKAEEYLTAFSDAIGKGELKWSDNLSATFMRLARPILNIFKGKGFAKMEFENGRDVYDFIKDYQSNIKKGEVSKRGQELAAKAESITKKAPKLSITKKGQEFINLTKEGVYTNEDLVNIVNAPSSNQTDKFGAMDAVVEVNWPVISKGLKFNPTGSIPMDAVKTAVTEQMQGIFPGRNKELLADFNADTAQVNTYLGSLMRQRQAEILERAKQIGGVTQEGTSIDSEAARQVVAKAPTTTTVKEAKVAKKPTETVEFSQAQVEKIGAKNKAEVEAKVTKATNEAFKGQDIKTFGQTRNVPKSVADIYAGMFGLNPQTITDKTRNYQKTDAEGLTTAKQFLLKNANNDFARLPKTKDGFGKGTFLPRNVMNALYTDGKLTGTLKDYINLIRQKPVKPIYRDAVGQTIRGLLNLHIRNRMFEDLVTTTPERLRGGAKFSKTKAVENINTFIENQAFEKVSDELAAENKRWSYIAKTAGVDFISSKNPEDVKKMQDWVLNVLAPKVPKSFFTNGTFANAGVSAAKRGFFFTSGMVKRDGTLGELGVLLKDAVFAKENENIKKAVSRETYVTGGAQGKVSERFIKKFNSEQFKKEQQAKLDGLKDVFKVFETLMKEDKNNTSFVIALLSSTSQGMGHFVRTSAPVKFYAKDVSSGIVEEHTMPASLVSKYLFKSAFAETLNKDFKNIEKNYFQGALPLADDKKLKGIKPNGKPFNYTEITPEGWKLTDNIWARYFNINVANTKGGIDPNNIVLSTGKTVFETFSITPSGLKLNEQGIKDVPKVEKALDEVIPKSMQSKTRTSAQQNVYNQGVLDGALNQARRPDAPVKKIRVFDFDDTLARSKSMVIVNMPVTDVDLLDIAARRKFKKQLENLPSREQTFYNLTKEQQAQVLKEVPGATKKINATEFAAQAADLEAQGATFDFTEFSKVVEGKKGPLFSVAQKIAEARGAEDIFILTARPQDAAGPIQAFMKANGIDIPLKNITGLGDGTAAAKGRWIAGKAAEGYNDFYFADDAIKNVQAVKDVLSQVDVKSKVQQAKFSKTKVFDKVFNDIIEAKTGIESYKQFSAAKAKTVGASKGKFTFFTTPSAEDFLGLLYKTLGKGKVGDAQMAFYKTNLLDPYNRAEIAISQAKVAAGRDYKALKKQFKNIPKTLEKETGIAKYTYQHAIRTYIWNSQGLEVPGLSKRDQKRLTDFVKADPELQAFADQLVNIQKGKPYPKPDKDWTAGNITTDVISGINKVNRAEYLQEWQENVDIIFSEKNMNKLEAAFGAKYVEALKDSLRAMKSGSNRPLGGDRVSNGILDWLNNSVGAIMFLNTRSAVLQTISAVNFINWGDNNILKAGKAFANQKQFWSDFLTLMNSDYLLERRDGLKINVSESEIADAVEGSKNKVNAAISFLLNKGFVFTRYADSFAIASGGATFYRNRTEALVEQGMDRKAAEKQAFNDFRAIAEENQQSSSPMRISQQQRSLIGRIILQFGNTQLQYVRIQKRAVQDLVNKRGDWKSNISKIVYYGAIQNLLFNALQSGLAWALFDDDEDDEELTEKNKEQKFERTINGAIDSQLKGLGIQGAVIAGVKNALITIAKEADKNSPKFEEALDDLLSIAPALGSKIRKIKSAARTVSWNRKEIKEKGFSMDNPAYLAGAQVISAAFNIPLDRAVMKMNNMRNILNPATEAWQKVALALGWSGWDVGLPYFGLAEDKPVLTETEKQTKKLFDLNKSDQVKMLLDLGLTKKEIRALTKEEQRVQEIIKLQNKKK